MRLFHTLSGLLVLGITFIFSGGCMRGATYRIPLPDSITLGTVKPDADAELASHESATRPSEARPGAPRHTGSRLAAAME